MKHVIMLGKTRVVIDTAGMTGVMTEDEWMSSLIEEGWSGETATAIADGIINGVSNLKNG